MTTTFQQLTEKMGLKPFIDEKQIGYYDPFNISGFMPKEVQNYHEKTAEMEFNKPQFTKYLIDNCVNFQGLETIGSDLPLWKYLKFDLVQGTFYFKLTPFLEYFLVMDPTEILTLRFWIKPNEKLGDYDSPLLSIEISNAKEVFDFSMEKYNWVFFIAGRVNLD